MLQTTLEIIVILALILANGLFAMAEIAIVSARRVRLKQRARTGDHAAAVALDLAADPNRFLSTIQIGITLIGIFAGAFGGRTLADPLGELIARLPVLASYSQTIALVLVVAGITYLTLVIGELAPKRLALTNPEGIASRVAPLMQFLSRITAPFVKVLSASTGLIVRLLGVTTADEPPITEEELRVMLHEGTESGVFKVDEEIIINRVLNVADQRIGALMIPRTKVVMLDLSNSPEMNQQQILDSQHEYFPVYEERQDQIVGVISIKELWARSITNEDTDLRQSLRPPLFAPESAPVLNVLDLFKHEHAEIAIIINEHGEMEGIVTLNDLLEALVGDIPLLTDQMPEPGVVQRADGTWLVDGLLPVTTLEQVLAIDFVPDDEIGNYRTVGGFMMKQIGRIPVEADVISRGNLSFEVVDMDHYRIDKVLVTRIED